MHTMMFLDAWQGVSRKCEGYKKFHPAGECTGSARVACVMSADAATVSNTSDKAVG